MCNEEPKALVCTAAGDLNEWQTKQSRRAVRDASGCFNSVKVMPTHQASAQARGAALSLDSAYASLFRPNGYFQHAAHVHVIPHTSQPIGTPKFRQRVRLTVQAHACTQSVAGRV